MKWILENKEWIFSGMGIAVFSAFVKIIKKYHNKERSREYLNDSEEKFERDSEDEVVRNNSAILEASKEVEDRRDSNFSRRLKLILNMINECGYGHDEINLEVLGEIMGEKSVNRLKKYYYEKNEPDYEFQERLATVLGVNKKWLKTGKGRPYQNDLKRHYNAKELLREFDDVKNIYFFTIKDVYRRELGVIINKDTYIYECYPRAFTFHSDVGAGGASELFSVYEFLKKLYMMQKMPSDVWYVSEEEFSKFLIGEIYPGLITKHQREKANFMLDDFIDLYNSDKKKKEYCQWYGKTFVDSQDLIKRKIANQK